MTQTSHYDKTLMCKFWLKGRCGLNEDCKFAHSEEEKRAACKVVPCQFQAKGRCRLGTECLYSHSEENLSHGNEAVPKNAEHSISNTDDSEDEVNLPTDISEQQESEGAERILTTGSSRSEADASLESDASTTASIKPDKTLICKFWLKNRCEKGSACCFAHGESEKMEACKVIQCEYYARGRCRLGDECLYLHSEEPVIAHLESLARTEPKPATVRERMQKGKRSDKKSGAFCSLAGYSKEIDTPGKTKLCMFWLSNKCQRGSSCKFAHGEEEKRKARSSILCRFIAAGTLCDLGDECMFSHSEDTKSAEGKACYDAEYRALASQTSTATELAVATSPAFNPAFSPSFSAASTFDHKQDWSEPGPRLCWADLSDEDGPDSYDEDFTL